jgi:DNA-binding NtrC family response regulator
MPARVVVVHDEPAFSDELVAALTLRGHEVAAFVDPMAAWDAVDAAQCVEVLITRVQFAPGKSNGIALALAARRKRPGIRIVFTALAEFASSALGLGEFMSMPVGVPEVVDIVDRILQPDGQG